jgi:hypothetical protein
MTLFVVFPIYLTNKHLKDAIEQVSDATCPPLDALSNCIPSDIWRPIQSEGKLVSPHTTSGGGQALNSSTEHNTSYIP